MFTLRNFNSNCLLIRLENWDSYKILEEIITNFSKIYYIFMLFINFL